MKFILKALALIAAVVVAYFLPIAYEDGANLQAREKMAIEHLTDLKRENPADKRREQQANQPVVVPLKQRVAAAAQVAQVKIISYQETAGEAAVTIQWKSGNFAQGGEFLDELIKNGAIRDFNAGQSSTYTNSSGQYVHTQQVTLIPY